MNIIKQRFNFEDVKFASVNNQLHYTGNNLVEADNKKVFFITAVKGTVTLKDAGGNTVLTVTDNAFNYPIRFDQGFTASGTGISVVYFFIEVMPNDLTNP